MLITERYTDKIIGILRCYDRVIIRVTPSIMAFTTVPDEPVAKKYMLL